MTAQRFYKPELDVLRFIAFLFVFFTHRMDMAPIDPKQYFWAHHISLVGTYGVPLFFFLSAFLITELLIREQSLYQRISVKSFYARRILRIWPLYFIFFFGAVLLTHHSTQFGEIPARMQLAFTFFGGNWYITNNGWQAYIVNPLWSISVEEQLYIILPLLAFYGGKKGLKIFSILAFAIAYGTIIYYATKPTTGFSGEWTNSFVQFQFFAAGILTSVLLKGRQPKWPFAVRAPAFAAGLASWLVASLVCGVHADAPHLSTIPQAICGWALILTGVVLFFFSFYGAATKFMPSPLVYLGRISYGLYVFHITFFYLAYYIYQKELANFTSSIGLYEWKNNVGFVLVFIVTVVVAILSHHLLEKPFLRLKRKFTFIPSRD